MKKNLFAFVLLLMGCTADEQFEQILGSGTSEREPVPVTFSVSEVLDLTRASSSIVTFDANEQIMVQVKPDGESDYTGYTYTTASAGQSSITLNPPSTPPYFPAGASTTVQAYAYYPATAGSSATFTVQDNQTSDANYKASDLMYAGERTITKGSEDGNNNLRMAHLMAQLHLTVSATALTVNRVLVFAKRSATFSTTQGTAVATGGTDSIVAATAAGQAYVCIPEQPINTVTIKVETGAQNDAATTATFTFTSSSNFEVGKSYPISLSVTPAHLATTTEIEDWDGTSAYAAGYLTIDDITESFINDGTPKTPEPIVKFNGVTLTKDVDYTLSYLNNTKTGIATVVAAGKAGTVYEGATAATDYLILGVEMNPLYYMSLYNSVSSDAFGSVANSCYYYTWATAMSTFANNTSGYSDYRTAGKGPNKEWHLPVAAEWLGIIPNDYYESNRQFQNMASEAGALWEDYVTPKWGYNSSTKAGISETSWLKKISNTEIHAVRFVGTPYVSAWKYVCANTRWTISATLIDDNTLSKDNVAAWYTENWGNGRYSTFTNDYSVGKIQRELYLVGYGNGDSANAVDRLGTHGYYWSATPIGSYVSNVDIGTFWINVSYGYSVNGHVARLFKDN